MKQSGYSKLIQEPVEALEDIVTAEAQETKYLGNIEEGLSATRPAIRHGVLL